MGNGNPGSHESDKANKRHAFNGLCQLIVQSDVNSDGITIKALSEELVSDTIKIQTFVG